MPAGPGDQFSVAEACVEHYTIVERHTELLQLGQQYLPLKIHYEISKYWQKISAASSSVLVKVAYCSWMFVIDTQYS